MIPHIQQLTIPPGGFTGWHTHPGPTFVAVAQGQGTLYHAMAGCPSVKYGAGAGFHAAADRGSQHEERGLDAARLVGVLCAAARDREYRDPHRSASAGGMSEHSVARDPLGAASLSPRPTQPRHSRRCGSRRNVDRDGSRCRSRVDRSPGRSCCSDRGRRFGGRLGRGDDGAPT